MSKEINHKYSLDEYLNIISTLSECSSEIRIEIDNSGMVDVYFTPNVPINYIEVKCLITRPNVEFSELG